MVALPKTNLGKILLSWTFIMSGGIWLFVLAKKDVVNNRHNQMKLRKDLERAAKKEIESDSV